MKKTTVFFLLFFLIMSSTANAFVGSITSDFGWRTHPIFGKTRYHTGVDIGGNYGEVIPAAKAGVVSFAGWYGGYGKAVIINHADGTQTLYAHCQELLIFEGMQVAAGQTIALLGSTGNSTGPHVHVEYIVNGEYENPVPFLISVGWNLTGGGNYDIMRSDEDEMPWDFGDYYNIAEELRTQLEKISDQCKDGMKVVEEESKNLLKMLMIIDLALSCILLTISDNSESLGSFLVKKVLKYGFVIWLVGNWGDFVNMMILDTFSQAAIAAGGDSEDISKEISDPSKIIQKGVFIVQPVFNFLKTFSGLNIMLNIHHVIIAILLGLAILACYIVIGIQFFVTYLQFYIISALSIVVLPFGTVKHLKFLGEKGIGAVINVGIKLMIMTFMVSLIVSFAKSFTPEAYSTIAYLKVLLVSLVLVCLTSGVSSMMKLLQVSPKL